jgi:glycyl-tRNA synthetase beta chain
MSDLLFEIGTEEMPSVEIPGLAEELRINACAAFTKAALSYRDMRIYYTPRRLALFVQGLSPKQKDRVEEGKGPPVEIAFDAAGHPTPAALGFARQNGIKADELVTLKVGDREYVGVRRVLPGRATEEVLPEILPPLVTGLHPGKMMRWDSSGLMFIRPIRWLVCMYGDSIIPVRLKGLRASDCTHGHRLRKSEPIRIPSASKYLETLSDRMITVDPQARELLVIEAAKQVAHEHNEEYILDEQLLSHIVNGAEYPTPVLGHIPAELLKLPGEVIRATLQEEGKFIGFVQSGRPVAHFMGFRDGPPDQEGIVQAGFERVVYARLRDAQFFFEKDRQQPLANAVRNLRGVIYDARLGSLWDKVGRIRAVAGQLTDRIGSGVETLVDRAAFLCKADLTTQMVKEFPALQGVAGGIYAELDEEPPAVVAAIRGHYLPLSNEDEAPTDMVTIIVGLADRLDTVVGAILAGEEPTGSRDPYGIKRQANGLIRLAIEREIDLDFFQFIDQLKETYSGIEHKGTLQEVKGFLAERLTQLLRGQYGLPSEAVASVLAINQGNFYRAFLRAKVMGEFQGREEFIALATGFSRVSNITKSNKSREFSPTLFEAEAEKDLWRAYLKVEGQTGKFLGQGKYAAVLEQLLSLKGPIDRYFDEVLVMTDDKRVRENRLGFLSALTDLFSSVGDLSLITVENTASSKGDSNANGKST